MPIERKQKQIVITMTIVENTDFPKHGLASMMRTLQTELEVNDLGSSEVPEELFKEDELTSGKIEQEIYDLLKPYFENITGIPIVEESHRE